MSQLINHSFLGSRFYQDKNPNYLKINAVTLGESSSYAGYTINSGDISDVLKKCYQDNVTVVVLYNWEKKVAYTKTGFDLNNVSDSKENIGYTAFIVKSRITDSNLNYFSNSPVSVPISVPIPVPVCTHCSVHCPKVPEPEKSNSFVKWNSSKYQFELNNKKFVPVGFNAYWIGFKEEYVYPKQSEVTQMFKMANKMAATCIRAHTLGITSGHSLTLRQSDNSFNQNAFKAIDFAFQEANKYNIKLIIPLTDCYSYFHGHYGHWCETRGVHKDAFFKNKDVRDDFKSNINGWLNHKNTLTGIKYKDDPALFMIELGNEFGNYRPGAGSVAIPTFDWLQDISNYIKTIDNKHLILSPSDESLGKSNEFKVENLDCYGAHFYWKDYYRLDKYANASKDVGKGYIVGEYGDLSDEWFNDLESRVNVHGTVMWSLYYNENGDFNGNPIVHNDGFTINWCKNDMWKLVKLSNHFRRMQQIPQIKNLN